MAKTKSQVEKVEVPQVEKYIKTCDNPFEVDGVSFNESIEVSEKMKDSKRFKRALELGLIKKA